MEILLPLLSYFPWHLFCITSRDHTVGLGPEGPDDSGLPRPSRAHCRSAHMASNRLTLAMCSAVEAFLSVCP